MNTNCPDDATISKCLAGNLPEVQIESLFLHIENCSKCQSRVPKIEHSDLDQTLDLSSWLRDSRNDEPVPISCQRLIDDSQRLLDSVPASAKDYKLDSIKAIRDYEILSEIGSGGMGHVFLARHNHLKRHVAVKVLLPSRFESQQAILQFRTEMEAVGNLNHPNIVRALDAGEYEGIHYLVMDYEEGQDLKRIVENRGPIKLADAAEVVRQTALGLSYAHSQSMVHRDIKPSNLIVTPSGRLRILDFGLALLDSDRQREQVDVIAGSLGFMAPEQKENSSSVDEKADVFSLGATFIFALTGRHHTLKRTPMNEAGRPGVENTPSSTLHSRKIPRKIRQLIDVMVDSNPMIRPSTNEIATVLAEYEADSNLAGLVSPASSPNSAGATKMHTSPHGIPFWRRPFVPGLVVLVVISLLAAPFLLKRSPRELPTERSNAGDIVFPNSSRTVAIAVCGEVEGKEVSLYFAPGRELEVLLGDNEKHQAWDLLDLRFKSENAFGTYDWLMNSVSEFIEVAEKEFQAERPLPDFISGVHLVGDTANGSIIDVYRPSVRARWFEHRSGEIDVRVVRPKTSLETNFEDLQAAENSDQPFSTVFEEIKDVRSRAKNALSK